MTKFEKLSEKISDTDIIINNRKILISNYNKYIISLENKILNKEIELENFFHRDFTKSFGGSVSIICYDHNIFEIYLELIKSLDILNKKLEEAKKLYNDLFTEIEENN